MAYRPAHGGSTGPARAAAGTVVLGLSILLTGLVVAPPAAANGDRIYLDCPCEIDSDGTTARVTAGVRSFRSTDTVPLSLAILVSQSGGDYFIRIGKVTVAESLEADGSLESDTYEVQLEVDPGLSGSQDIELFLYEERANRPIQLDRVRMESPVDPTGAFRVADLDYLEDSDGDGVGDVNEGLAGTDPADAEATPPDSTLDVLALYSQSVPEIYRGDPTTRIQQLFVLANTMLADSGVDLSYRVVGLVEVELDESSNSPSLPTQKLIVCVSTTYAVEIARRALQTRARMGFGFRRSSCRYRHRRPWGCPRRRGWPVGWVRPRWPCARAGCARRRA